MKNLKERLNVLNGDTILGLVGFLFGMYIIFVAVPNTVRMPLRMTHFYQRPDVLPYATGVLIALFSAIILFQSLLKRRGQEQEETQEEGCATEEEVPLSLKELFLSVGLLIVCIGLYIALLPVVGYLIPSMVFLGCVLLICGYRNIVLLVVLSAGVPFLLRLFFERFLYVFLP